MIRFLLDTNILSEPTKRSPDPAVLAKLQRHAGECATASVVWKELWHGCLRLPSRRRQELERYLQELAASAFPLLPYDAEAARLHAEMAAQLEARGLQAGQADGEIAAIARCLGLRVVTRKLRHFQDFPDLVVENWFQA